MVIFSNVAFANSNIDAYIFNNSAHVMTVSYQVCASRMDVRGECNAIKNTVIIPAIGSSDNVFVLHGLSDGNNSFIKSITGFLYDTVNILDVTEEDVPSAHLIQKPCGLSLFFGDTEYHTAYTSIVLSDYGTGYITCNKM